MKMIRAAQILAALLFLVMLLITIRDVSNGNVPPDPIGMGTFFWVVSPGILGLIFLKPFATSKILIQPSKVLAKSKAFLLALIPCIAIYSLAYFGQDENSDRVVNLMGLHLILPALFYILLLSYFPFRKFSRA